MTAALVRASPAPAWETMALIRRAGWLHARVADKAARQTLGSVTVGWSDAAGPVAVLGLLPVGAGAECWLAGEGARARPHLLAIARDARLTLAAMDHHGVAPIEARVRVGHEPGRRLARLVGFRLHATEGDVELWRWGDHGGAGEDDRRGRGQEGGAGRLDRTGAPASAAGDRPAAAGRGAAGAAG